MNTEFRSASLDGRYHLQGLVTRRGQYWTESLKKKNRIWVSGLDSSGSRNGPVAGNETSVFQVRWEIRDWVCDFQNLKDSASFSVNFWFTLQFSGNCSVQIVILLCSLVNSMILLHSFFGNCNFTLQSGGNSQYLQFCLNRSQMLFSLLIRGPFNDSLSITYII
jgi:hypothetical protein